MLKGLFDELLNVLVTVLLNFKEDVEDNILLIDKCLVSLFVPNLVKDVFFDSSLHDIVLVMVNVGLDKEVVAKVLKLL